MKTELYEWLARWRDGSLSGYHVQLLTTYDDGKQSISDAMTPAQAEAQGFTLTGILDKLHTDALAAVAAKDVEIADTISANEILIATAASEKATELAAKDAELAAKTAENAATVAAKDAEIAAKAAEIAAEAAIATAAKALANKIAEVAAIEKDDPDRETKEAEAEQLADQVTAKDAELAFIKLPETEKARAKIQAEIDRLQAELAK